MAPRNTLLVAFGHRLRAVAFSAFRFCGAAGGEKPPRKDVKLITEFMADDQTPAVPVETPPESTTPVVETVSSVPDPPIPSNPPDVPIVETPTPEPEPVVTSEPTPKVTPELSPIDVPIPNFRFPFNDSYPVTFPFNASPTTEEMKAKFAQWGISGHHGIDFGLPERTEFLAVDSGKVFQSSENGDYGNSVTIQHPWGKSLYAHLKETKVTEDQEVKAGDLIGISGQTGAAFGLHLHFGIKPNNPNEANGYLGFIDPTQYLPAVSQTPNTTNPPNPPDNPVPEPEPPPQPTPEPKPEEPKPVEVPIPDVSINIEPVIPPTQPIQPPPPSNPTEPVVNDEQIQKQVDEKINTELEARRLKANEVRKDKRQEHLQAVEKLLQEKKEITNQDVRDLTHVSQTTATEYLSTLVKSGTIKMEGKGKATVYKNIFS